MKHFLKIISLSCITICSVQAMDQVLTQTYNIAQASDTILALMNMNIAKRQADRITDEFFVNCMRYEWELFKDTIEGVQSLDNPDLQNSLIITFWNNLTTHVTHLERLCHQLPLETNPWLEKAYRELAPIYNTYFAHNEAISDNERHVISATFIYLDIRFTLNLN